MSERSDLDQSGHGYQRARTYLGPSLGWVDELVEPATQVILPGTYVVKPGDSLLLCAVPAGVTIQLPDVREWVSQKAYQPGTAFDRSITIKDIGSFANVGNILVKPKGFDQIDMRQQPVALSLAGASVRFIPLIDVEGAPGWAMEASWGLTTPVGGGDVFKNQNNTFTGINIFTNTVEGLTLDITEDSGQMATTAFVHQFWAAQIDNFVTKNPVGNQFIHGVNTFDGLLETITQDTTESTGSVATTEFVHNVVIAADAPIDGPRYGRQVGNWVNLDAVYFPNTGGVITGGVAIHGPSPVLTLFPTAAGQSVGVFGTNFAQKARWGIQLNDGSAELGSNTGSNFTIARFNDAGVFIDNILLANRQTGQITLGANLNLPGDPVLPNQAATKAYIDAKVIAGGGNVNNVGTPAANEYARWTTATTIEGRSPAQVLADIGAQPAGSYQPLDATLTAFAGLSSGIDVLPYFTGVDAMSTTAFSAIGKSLAGAGTAATARTTIGAQAQDGDLDALAALTGTNNIYYRSGASAWTSVAIGGGLSFSGGTLSAVGGGGDVFSGGVNTFSNQNYFSFTPLEVGTTVVYDSAQTAEFHTTAASAGRVAVYNWGSNAAFAGINIVKSRGGGVGVQGIVSAGDGGQINFQASDGGAFRGYASITGSIDSAPAPGVDIMPGKLEFSTRGGGAGNTQTVKLTIDRAGVVTIPGASVVGVPAGTTGVPSGNLNVAALTGAAAVVGVSNWQAAGAGSCFFNILRCKSGTIGVHTGGGLASGDTVGEVDWFVSDGAAFFKAISLLAVMQGTAASGHGATRLGIYTDNGTTSAERDRIWASGGMTFIGPTWAASTDPGAGIIECELRGQVSASNPSTGCVGEYLTAQNVTNQPLTSGTPLVVNSISLTPGDWDIWCKSAWTTGGTTGNAEIELWTGTTISGTPGQYVIQAAPGASVNFSVIMPQLRVNVAATTTINLVARSSVANMAVTNSNIFARRRR